MLTSIYSHQYLIGHADLQPGDEAMGGLYGELIPTAEYYSRVQQAVWEFRADTSPDYSKWYALALNAQLENGYFLFPLGGYEIADSPDFPHEPKHLYLTGIAAEIIEDFIKIDPPRTFVEEPWEPLTAQQKLALEAELGREIGLILPKTAALVAHSLISTQPKFSALCRFGASDDVLFSIYYPTSPNSNFALVHLTWSGAHEKHPSFPKTIYFDSFAEFKLERMYPDKTDWED